MKLFSANIADFHTLYVTRLEKALDMERRMVKALPAMARRASDIDLSIALENHLEETKAHVNKVESLLALHGNEARSRTCKAMEGLAANVAETMKDVTDRHVLDIALIGAAQEMEHHEIAVYGTLKAWARLLGLAQDVAWIETIEEEEAKTDGLLTALSTRVNRETEALTAVY